MSILSTGKISGEKNDYKMFKKMLVNCIVLWIHTTRLKIYLQYVKKYSNILLD